MDFNTRPAKFDSTLGRRLEEQGLKSHDTVWKYLNFKRRKVRGVSLSKKKMLEFAMNLDFGDFVFFFKILPSYHHVSII